MKIAITGNIGSGKSTIANVLKHLGAKHFDADQSAKSMYLKPAVKALISSRIDAKIYVNDDVNWTYLKSEFYKNPELKIQLEQLIHPLVFESYINFELQNQNTICLFESALLFETGRHAAFKTIICVCAPESLRINRLMQRPDITLQHIQRIMHQQMHETEKAKKSTHILVNNETTPLLETLIQWVETWNSQLDTMRIK
jgi:dephospho-CoA kinase